MQEYGQDKIIRLYNLQGELVKSFKTSSGHNPWDIAVKGNGDLVYTSFNDKTVNVVNNKGMHAEISVKGWSPRNITSSFSGDLLIVMYSDNEETTVVRYSGPIEKQTIQYDENGIPLYSTYFYTKYISENRNLDNCVSDSQMAQLWWLIRPQNFSLSTPSFRNYQGTILSYRNNYR